MKNKRSIQLAVIINCAIRGRKKACVEFPHSKRSEEQAFNLKQKNKNEINLYASQSSPSFPMSYKFMNAVLIKIIHIFTYSIIGKKCHATFGTFSNFQFIIILLSYISGPQPIINRTFQLGHLMLALKYKVVLKLYFNFFQLNFLKLQHIF